MSLFHISEDPAIPLFVPRPSAYTAEPVVWAITPERLVNYLLPRDCPRVCFWARADSTMGDRQTLLGQDAAVIAIEAGWFERVQQASLYCYSMPPEGFVELDANAGYWVSTSPVWPIATTVMTDLPDQIARRGASLRVLPHLGPLQADVAASSLGFSMIRMRNAAAI
ncbi:DUF6886 family protein [Devosia sp. FKR38]|uniref:DUF6886 family protein n=1 Tax=Devosia sp. FKR38 TaxID=2562312 RepID=UPI0010C128A8|nr:DUF6886 family protein [Devosia sp. FKR38]